MNFLRWTWLFVKFILLGVLSIPMTIFAKAICWILPFFVEGGTRKLPSWLSWFDTPNSTADGDPAHQNRHQGSDRFSTYKRRTAWYWRNSAYGFDRTVCGVEVLASDFMSVKGVRNAGRRPFIPGTCLRLLYNYEGKPKAWFLYFCLSWPFGIFDSRCIRGSIGWKLWLKEPHAKGYGLAMWSGMINPFFSKE